MGNQQFSALPSSGLAWRGSETKLRRIPKPRPKKSPSGTSTLGLASPSQKIRSTVAQSSRGSAGSEASVHHTCFTQPAPSSSPRSWVAPGSIVTKSALPPLRSHEERRRRRKSRRRARSASDPWPRSMQGSLARRADGRSHRGTLSSPHPPTSRGRMAHAPPQSLEAARVGPYLVLLFGLLSTATLFDGFDAAMLGLAAPDARATLGISRSEWGYLSGFTRLGVMLSFLLLLQADRLGRRRLLMVTVLGFTLASGATAFVTDRAQFAACQFLARLFLTAEYSLAIIVVGEEFPARLRGRAIAILTSLATVGVMLMAKLQPFVLLPEGAQSNCLHALGSGLVRAGHSPLGVSVDGANWGALYVLGAFPLVLVGLLRFALPATP